MPTSFGGGCFGNAISSMAVMRNCCMQTKNNNDLAPKIRSFSIFDESAPPTLSISMECIDILSEINIRVRKVHLVGSFVLNLKHKLLYV